MRLAGRYGARAEHEWPALFHRILQNRIRDWQRRNILRSRIFGWLPGQFAGSRDADPFDATPDPGALDPARAAQTGAAMSALTDAVRALPGRQREVFLLRAVEELDVAQTAATLGISAGSVKTHYSRALNRLREELGDHWS